MNKPNIHRLIELQQLLLEFQSVERFVRNPLNPTQHENNVEHSYHLAMAVWFLASHFGLDRDRCIRLALAHDLVEVYAGDTPAFGSKNQIDTKTEREQAAQETLQRKWPDFMEMNDCIEEYKTKSSEEAKFVYALDKIMPAILNYLNGGLAWQEAKVTLADYRAEKERKIPRDSPVYPYHEELLELILEHPDLLYSNPNYSQQR